MRCHCQNRYFRDLWKLKLAIMESCLGWKWIGTGFCVSRVPCDGLRSLLGVKWAHRGRRLWIAAVIAESPWALLCCGYPWGGRCLWPNPKISFIFLWHFIVQPGREFCIQNHFIPGLPKYFVCFLALKASEVLRMILSFDFFSTTITWYSVCWLHVRQRKFS